MAQMCNGQYCCFMEYDKGLYPEVGGGYPE